MSIKPVLQTLASMHSDFDSGNLCCPQSCDKTRSTRNAERVGCWGVTKKLKFYFGWSCLAEARGRRGWLPSTKPPASLTGNTSPEEATARHADVKVLIINFPSSWHVRDGQCEVSRLVWEIPNRICFRDIFDTLGPDL